MHTNCATISAAFVNTNCITNINAFGAALCRAEFAAHKSTFGDTIESTYSCSYGRSDFAAELPTHCCT